MTGDLNLTATFDTPEVTFEPGGSIFRLRGKSMPEDPIQFYEPILSWVRSYGKQASPSTTVIIDLEYFNSSSLKQLIQIFSILEGIADSDHKVKVEWHYDPSDELMQDKGLEIQSIINLEFELVPKASEFESEY